LRFIDKRMHYFKDLVRLAKVLSAESSALLDSAKALKSKIDFVLGVLKNDYSADEIEENFEEDQEWVDAFAEDFIHAIEGLQALCKTVMKDCVTRKRNIDDALIWN